jgi:hypothetical protein
MNKKYQDYVEVYNNTFKYFESTEPTESYESISFTKCPTLIPTLIPSLIPSLNQTIIINEQKSDKNDINIELIIIILPTLFFVLIIFFIGIKFKQIKYKNENENENKNENENENENFGTTINDSLDF